MNLKRVESKSDYENWNNFISSNAEFATIANNPSLVDILKRIYGWEGVNYFIQNDGNNIGSINLVEISNKLVSMPHFSYGGFTIANNQETNKREIFKELENTLDRKIEIRDFIRLSEHANVDKITSYKSLIPDVDKQLMELSSNQRRKVRKSYKNGLKIKIGKEYFDGFYDIYCSNMHDLGSPPLSKNFFNTILENYKYGNAEIFCSEYQGKIVGGGFLLGYQKFFENCWFSTLGEYNNLYTSLFIYWEMIKYSIENEAEIFSFGRSTKNSPLHKFKSHWGTEDKQLYFNYSYDKNLNVKNFEILGKVWSKLPRSFVDKVGPYFAGKIY
ncbi:GNAT family N-acetyltransferase [Gracilimonas sp. Q87]|uniref:GNAT family N-acetyltransferase n=1 Tax=Gracilimonas sp. Q87 TaxID=3384766 RepID=UPI0039840CA8